MKQAAIFDLDGVIVDSSPYHFRAWQALGSSIGRTIDDAFFRKTFGMTNRSILELLLDCDADASQLRELAAKKEEHYRRLVRGNIIALPGAVSLIQDFADAGWAVGLGTSAPRENVEIILAELGIASCFSALSMEGDYAQGKPAPDVFLVAAQKLGVSPAQCVVFEDAVVGIAAAKAGGMKVVAVTNSTPRDNLLAADLTIDSLEEVSAKLLLLLWR